MGGAVAVLLGIAACGLVLVLPVVFLYRFDPTSERHNRSEGRDSGQHRHGTRTQASKTAGHHHASGGVTDWQEVRPRPARGEPIGPLSADLRRLRSRICTIDRIPAVHQIALYRAYDQALTDMCEMLEIEHELDRHSSVMERDLERLRVEAELEGRGIVLSVRAARRRRTG